MKHFDLSEQRLDILFGPWLVAVSVLLGIYSYAGIVRSRSPSLERWLAGPQL